jgi:hypothetical protein
MGSSVNLLEVTVGQDRADFVGTNHLALQAAVDYVSALGGGTVQILPGTYEMGNSLFLRSGLRLVGSGEDTVLRKCDWTCQQMTEDTDWYSNRVAIKSASAFSIGGGVLIRGKCPHYGKPQFIKRTVVAVDDNVLYLDKALRANVWLDTEPEAASLFPVITGEFVNDVTIESLIIDGNRANNDNLNGNYGGCIFIQDCNRIRVSYVTARDYNGDGISWQICDDVTIDQCRCINNSDLGLHPGSGSQRPIITDNTIIGSSQGLFFCWGIRHGRAEGNTIEDCDKYGISIGHRDTDNLVRNNCVRRSGINGVLFREHPSPARDPHRNVLEGNLIVDSGAHDECVAIEMLGTATGVVLRNNRIVDTRRKHASRNRIGIRIGEKIQELTMQGMSFVGVDTDILDKR